MLSGGVFAGWTMWLPRNSSSENEPVVLVAEVSIDTTAGPEVVATVEERSGEVLLVEEG